MAGLRTPASVPSCPISATAPAAEANSTCDTLHALAHRMFARALLLLLLLQPLLLLHSQLCGSRCYYCRSLSAHLLYVKQL
jgi:hypothetical protein